MEGSTYTPLAEALRPDWRVVALDQRGHGDSDHAKTYTRDDYLSDLNSLFAHLALNEPVVMLGNSLGGVNAYQFAARRPELVRALVIEDIGAVIGDDTSFALPWRGVYETREALVQRVGIPFSAVSRTFVSPDGRRVASCLRSARHSCIPEFSERGSLEGLAGERLSCSLDSREGQPCHESGPHGTDGFATAEHSPGSLRWRPCHTYGQSNRRRAGCEEVLERVMRPARLSADSCGLAR